MDQHLNRVWETTPKDEEDKPSELELSTPCANIAHEPAVDSTSGVLPTPILPCATRRLMRTESTATSVIEHYPDDEVTFNTSTDSAWVVAEDEDVTMLEPVGMASSYLDSVLDLSHDPQ